MNHAFQDHGRTVSVQLDLGSDLSRADIQVETTADTLAIARSSPAAGSTTILKTSQLYGTVDASATKWTLQQGGKLEVTLKKLPPHEPWPTLETGKAEEIKEQPSPGDALEARKNVKALLEAAQNGDVAMLKVRDTHFIPNQTMHACPNFLHGPNFNRFLHLLCIIC